jgi:hypothetical protein
LKKILALSFLFWIVFSVTGRASRGEAGQAGAFLRFGSDARAMALGNAFVSLADDASASYWNPAGMVFLEKPSLLSTLSVLSLGRRFNFFSATMPLGVSEKNIDVFNTEKFPDWIGSGWGQIAFSWISFSLGDDFEGRQLDTVDYYTFSDRQNAYLLSYGNKLTSWLSLGVTGKFIHRELEAHSALGSGLDLSLLMLWSKYLRIGLSVSDLLSFQRWDTGWSEYFPITTRVGISIFVLAGNLIFSAQTEGIQGRQPVYSAGIEAWIKRFLAFRTGYSENGFSVGGGTRILLQKNLVKFDYSYSQDALDLGGVQKLSLSISF